MFVSCQNGHYYDAKSSVCPYCDSSDTAVAIAPEKLAFGDAAAPSRLEDQEDKNSRFNPTVGWLVAVEGPATGRDYRLYAGVNTIGKLPGLPVSIEGDPKVAARNHAVVIYDVRANRFFLRPGNEGGISYVNDQMTESEVLLSPGSKIRVGSTTLVFVPLASDGFQW